MKKHDSRWLRFLTSFSYASLDVLSKQLATLFTYIHNTIYYIETSVLLKNIPLVKLIKTTSETRVVYFP